jgi:hypothetical protein
MTTNSLPVVRGTHRSTHPWFGWRRAPLLHALPRRAGLLWLVGLVGVSLASCGGSSSDESSAGGTAGSPPGPTGGGTGVATGGRRGTAGGAGGATGVEYPLIGVCGQRGAGTVTTGAYSGWVEFYLAGDGGFGDEVCVVRFGVTRVGAAPSGCDNPTAGVDCAWTHQVRLGNPEVVVDVDGACGNSELALDAARIASLDGWQVAYGFVSEYAGHVNVLMTREATGDWEPFGAATWDPDTGAFYFDHRVGYCGY